MDKQLVAEKLEALRVCVSRIETKRPKTHEVLNQDADLQDIISLNLTRAVQLCVDIAAHIISESNNPPPGTMAESFDLLAQQGIISSDLALNLKKAVGFRNIAVHNYQTIDWAIVHNVAHQGIIDFQAFAKAINKQL